jgi:hypothetical protein
MRNFILISIIFSLSAMQAAWCGEITLHIGTHSIRAVVANNSQSRAQGLKKIAMLCANCGMLFVFPNTGKYSFWMKDTPLPLSIAFIAADGIILNIAEMEANTLQTHDSQGGALYALEMSRGWFAEHHIKPQQNVQGLQLAPRGQ